MLTEEINTFYKYKTSIKVVHRFEPHNGPLPAHRILAVTVTCMFIPLLNTTEGSIIKSGLTTFNLS